MDYGMCVYGFSNPLMSTIINTILSIFTVFRYVNTRDLFVHYIFQLEEIMNCCITWTAALRELLITLAS